MKASIQPYDDAGNPVMFPDAPAYDPKHPQELLAHYVQIATLGDASAAYARWRCGTLSRQVPELYGHFLTDLDAEMALAGIAQPLPFEKWMAQELGR